MVGTYDVLSRRSSITVHSFTTYFGLAMESCYYTKLVYGIKIPIIQSY